jgi:CRISPR/Cas system-associated exonuclease Cas4 (RecB family)
MSDIQVPMDRKPVKWLIPTCKGEESPRIKTVSVTRMHTAEACMRRAALAYICKVPEPERQGESPPDRGSRHHSYIEDFITGKTPELHHEIKHHHTLIHRLAERYAADPDAVLVEQRWNFDNDWAVCGDNDWGKIWFILKLDVTHFVDYDFVHAHDWKTGKKAGNEVKHADQMLAYAISVFMRYPQVQKVIAELNYTDVNETTAMSLTRKNAMRFFPRLNKRLSAVTDATIFPPSPSVHKCRFCPYKTGKIDKTTKGTGHCDLNPT